VNRFNAQIEELLSSITSHATVFVDAVDQLQKPRDLSWLPAKLPKTMKLVLSVLNDAAYERDSDIYRDLRNRVASNAFPDAFLEIELLGRSQSREILSALEEKSRHRLQQGQRDYIIAKFEKAGGSPLYLRTSFEIAERQVLAEDTEGLISQFIAELSSVHHHEGELVTRTIT
jgi:hypothetical protein